MEPRGKQFAAKRRQEKQTHGAVTGGSSMWRWGIPVLCLVAAAAGTWAAFEFIVLSKLPRELLGKWVVVGGEQDGADFDFSRNGTMRGRVNVKGREFIVEARVRVVDKVLYSTTTNPNTGREETRTQSIVALTDKRLVLQDERGQLLELERANDRE